MLRWLLIGVGDISSTRVIPAILEEPGSRLAGLVTRSPGKAVPYAVPAFADLDDALNSGGFDAAYVATPVFLHASQTIKALQAGLHVLCEKPMALTLSQARSMVDAAELHGRTLGVAYYRRAYPKVVRTAELIRQGAIGQPLMAFASCHSELPSEQRSWLLDPAQAGGGPLYDIACHRIDLMNFFFGTPQEVHACLSNAVYNLAVEDSATLLIRYKNDVHAIVDVRWNSQEARDEFRILGRQGELDLTPLNGPRLVCPGGLEEIPRHSNSHYPCIENFVEAVLQGAPLLSSGASGLWTDWVIEGAVASNRRARDIAAG